MKRSILSSDTGTNELSELLTSERLKTAGVNVPKQSSQNDPDLDALFERVRSSKKAASQKGVSTKMLRKLAGI